MDAARRFWRLLDACAQLTRDESAAIHSRDFDTVVLLQGKKAPLLDELPPLAAAAGLDRSHPAVAARIDALIELERRNQETLGAISRQARVERQRLRGVGQSYFTEKALPGAGAFRAHG